MHKYARVDARNLMSEHRDCVGQGSRHSDDPSARQPQLVIYILLLTVLAVPTGVMHLGNIPLAEGANGETVVANMVELKNCSKLLCMHEVHACSTPTPSPQP